MAGILYMVATPIGNLEDITLRALNVLKAVDAVFCEDTRKTRILLQKWGISKQLISLHKFSEAKKTDLVLSRLESGECIAFVTDAGTPGISDPGARLTATAMAAGYKVVPIPGASAVMAALSASGFDSSSFVFLGFAPRKDGPRRLFFEKIAIEDKPAVFFETAHRILATLKVAAPILENRNMVIFRELTKIHEEIIAGTAESLVETLSAVETIKGEIVVAVEASHRAPTEGIDVEGAIRTLMDEGFSGKRLAIEAESRFGIKKSLAYDTFLELKDLSTVPVTNDPL